MLLRMRASNLEAAFSLPPDLGGFSLITCSGETYEGDDHWEANSISVACHVCDLWLTMKHATNTGNLWNHLCTDKHQQVRNRD
jgi:hypothetical protein